MAPRTLEKPFPAAPRRFGCRCRRRPSLAGVTIEWMEIEDVARVAGEALSMIAGADLKYLDLDQDPPTQRTGRRRDEFEVLDVDRASPIRTSTRLPAGGDRTAIAPTPADDIFVASRSSPRICGRC